MKYLLALLLFPTVAVAEAPKVVAARAEGQTIHVTIAHPDTGWDHYADGWEVVTADGTVFGLRELLHPHETEQPFTRSLTLDAPLPAGPVFVRARCSVDGWGAALAEVARD
ncbi:MAG: hypothetical protein KDK10_09380 [Maritimibacter sp.]|nr:hypothetical protein [Maritimibacter sp.]